MRYLLIIVIILLFLVLVFRYSKSNYDEDNTILMQIDSGLADKILSITGYKVICNLLGYKLEVNSNFCKVENRCYDPKLLNLKDIKLTDRTENYKKYINLNNSPTIVSPYIIYKELIKIKPELTFEQISKEYEKVARENVYFSDIVTKHSLPSGEYYGIHLRKGDKIIDSGDFKPDYHNTLNEFNTYDQKLIEDVLKLKEKLFVIVSEDEDYKKSFLSKLGNDIKLVELPQVEKELKDAVELLWLSQCVTIFQNVKFTGYSLLAALYGNSNLVNYEQNTGMKIYNSVVSLNGPKIYDTSFYEHISILNDIDKNTYKLV